MTMVISRPGPSPEDIQKIRTRLSGGNLPGAHAAVQTDAGQPPPPLLTDEQRATAAANLKARMDARRAAAQAPAATTTSAGTTTATGAKKGTKVAPAGLPAGTPVPVAHPTTASPQMIHDALEAATLTSLTPLAPIATGIMPSAAADFTHNKQTLGPRTYSGPAPTTALVKGQKVTGHKVPPKASATDELLT